MINSLTQYFAQNGQIILPNIGIIKYHKVEAVWENSKLLAPKETIIFEPSDSKPSKQFYHYLSDNLDLPYEQAIVQFDQFLINIFNNEFPHLELGNFGTLAKVNGTYNWTSTFNSSAYLKDIEIVPHTHQDEVDSEHSSQKDKWYIGPLVLFVLSILLILYKFL